MLSALRGTSTEILQRYAQSPPTVSLNLASLLSFGRPATSSSVLSSVAIALEEIPRRLAMRVHSLQSLPFIVGTNPYIANTLNAYRDSFQLLATYPPVKTLEDNKRFTLQLEALVQRHANDIPTMAKGFLESAKYMSPTQISNFLDGAIQNRISVRLIAEQHIAVSRALEEASTGEIGVVDTNLRVERMIRMCESYVAELCSATLGASPSVVIDGEVDATFAYVPVHLEYMLTEILKNSFRATVEHHKKALPPVRITLAPDMARIFSYAFTTAKSNDDEDAGGGPYAAQHVGGLANIGGDDPHLFSEITSKGLQTGLGSIAGLGYGLPMSKLYAKYFGGSLELVSLEGWGSDVFLKLRCLSDEAGSSVI
ncbi:Protein-serine/threonine kinase [Mycena indigotica]|uniref:Protein-serine/threonine kinase n=1 Tax=Mycena indigotica TaxID=2126181 RepID=A0A8H6VYR4_9AGAR|nr:Protein-serine/threonine kinase [Mycena indigotica]KAF7295188.1 Protein-serine/threonine kinase [Mycena indigotica]